jgi:hypothetical protein
LTPNPKKREKKKRRKIPKQESSKESCHQCNFPQQHPLYNSIHCTTASLQGIKDMEPALGEGTGKEGMFF